VAEHENGMLMTWLLLSLALAAIVCAGGLVLLGAGLRAGDRNGETLLSNIETDLSASVVSFTIENPAQEAVVIGARVRRGTLRALVEGGRFVQVPRRTTHAVFLAGRFDFVGAIAAADARTVRVAIPADIRRRGELSVAVGERERLRIIRAPLDFARRRSRPAPAPSTVVRAEAVGPGMPPC
jgi:hypothetical protein